MMRRLGAGIRVMLALAAAGALASLAGVAARAEQAIPEQQVKAAYILNFTRYANWPAPALVEPHAPLVVCMVGPGAADMARQLQHRAAGSHPLELRIVSRVEETEPCHAVYLALPERSRQSAWLTRMREQAILTIGDSASFLADGGMINMMLVDGSIRFEVNLTAAKHSGVSLNPRMLALAERVVGGDAK